jgi:hypothetical protein
MLPVPLTVLWSALAALGAAAGIGAYVRRRRQIDASRSRVDDEAIRKILATGSLTVDEDEPLDIATIDAEEQRFWSETWDEPDDFRA